MSSEESELVGIVPFTSDELELTRTVLFTSDGMERTGTAHIGMRRNKLTSERMQLSV